MRAPAWLSQTLFVELFLLLVAAPPLLFAAWFPLWMTWAALGLLAASWLWRRWRTRHWLTRTPADWPLYFLFLVMLPIAVLVAPPELRARYSLPRALVLIWNFGLFWTVTCHTSHRYGYTRVLTTLYLLIGTAIAILAPLGITWGSKFPILGPLLDRIPTVLRGVFLGAESGFSPNQVAGALLFVLPLAVALVLYPGVIRRGRVAWWLTLVIALLMAAVLVLTQSRGGLIGFAAGLAVMALLAWRWGRWLLVAGGALAVLTLPLWLNPLFGLVGGVALPGQAEELTTLSSRTEIWTRALYGIQDFGFTGMGLGTFRAVIHLLYPLFTIPPEVDLAHAHNFFLQSALDFGLPGLIALLAIYGVAIVQIVQLWPLKVYTRSGATLVGRPWAVGFAGVLIAQSVYSQFDAIAMGSRPGFLLWYCFALLFGIANFALKQQREGKAIAAPAMLSAAPVTDSPAPPVHVHRHRRHSSRRRTGWFLGLGVLVLFGVLFVVAGRIAFGGWTTYQSARQAVTALRAAARTADLAAVQVALDALEQDVSGLAQGLQPVAPVLPLLRGVPTVGPILAAAPELAAVGHTAVTLATDAVAAVQAQAPADAPLALHTVAAALGPALPAWTPRLQALQEQVDALPLAALAALAPDARAAAPAAALAVAGAPLGPHLPWLLGMDGPRTYLILVQNNDELRATGGFISAVGQLTVEQGQITGLDFADSYRFYHEGGAYPWAPRPMQEYMQIYLMLLRDANWSPHFPTAARVARLLYERETGVALDGVVAIDQTAVRRLLSAVEPLEVAGAEVPITSANFDEQVMQFWEQPLPAAGNDAPADASSEFMAWLARRKDFIPTIAAAAMAKLRAGAFDLAAAVGGVETSLQDRSIQVWVDNPPAQAVLAQAGWAGELQPAAGADYLAVVDTNMGYNKVDAVMQRALSYAVSWPFGPEQPAQAVLTLAYTHTLPASDPECDPKPRYGEGYADMMARCYFDYVRVLAPGGSVLANVDGIDPETVTTTPTERGLRQFAGFLLLPPGESRRVTFTYSLPAGITPENYRLVLQRQAGIEPLPVQLTVGEASQATVLTDATLTWAPEQ